MWVAAQVDRGSRQLQTTRLHCVDLAGAERPSKNGEENESAIIAMMTHYRGGEVRSHRAAAAAAGHAPAAAVHA